MIAKRVIYVGVALVVISLARLAASQNQQNPAMNSDPSSKQSVSVYGPLFIATVFLVDRVDHSLVELCPQIDRAFDLEGLDVLSSAIEKFYFPAPLAYPFRFSSSGLQEIKSRLAKIGAVDSESIQVTKFPNIPLREQSRFEPVDLSKILINEECIRFRLKDWSNVDFLYFPTFLIARFDYRCADC
jgi:hypothetical protein